LLFLIVNGLATISYNALGLSTLVVGECP